MNNEIKVTNGNINYVLKLEPARAIIDRRVYNTEKAKKVVSYVTDYLYEGERFYHNILTIFEKRNGEKFVYRHEAWRGKQVFTDKEFAKLNICDGSGLSRTLNNIEELESTYRPLYTYNN